MLERVNFIIIIRLVDGISWRDEVLQVNGEYFGHGTLSMSLQDPGQHHHLHQHHVSLAAMQMPMNPADGMM